MNPFHAQYRQTQGFGCTGYPAEPAYKDCQHFHPAIDLVGPSDNCKIYATTPGYIYACGVDIDKDIYVLEKADDGTWHFYAHFSDIYISHGQRVTTDTCLGLQGMSGNATGPHLHYGVYTGPVWLGLKNPLTMTPIDPSPYIQDTGGLDMQTTEVVKGIYRLLDPTYQPSDEVIGSQAARIEAEGKIDGVLSDILLSKPWRNPEQCNVFALEIYDRQRGGENPLKFAQDRVLGGDTFESVYFRDKAIDAATFQGKETAWINQMKDLQAKLTECQDTQTVPPETIPLPREATIPPVTLPPMPPLEASAEPKQNRFRLILSTILDFLKNFH